MLPKCFWVWVHPLEPGSTPLKETKSLSRSYRLLLDPQLVLEPPLHLCLDSVWLGLAQVCACGHKCCGFICVTTLRSDMMVLLYSFATAGSCSLSASFSSDLQVLGGDGVMSVSHLGLRILKSLVLCTLAGCGCLC